MAHDRILDFSAVIVERTRDFTGRTWVFEKIETWLEEIDAPRTFLLTGSPGSGKTAVAARLVQMSLGEVASDPHQCLGRDALAYFHFCQANSDARLHPLRFVEALSRALANRYDAFREALLATGDRDITINATQSVTTAAGGSQVQNVVINELRIGALSARSAFDRVVRSPLEALVASGFDKSLVVLVDSMDEALTFPGDENLVALLGHAGDLPQMRFILTSRADKRVTTALGEPALDLIEDAPANVDDVRTYVEARLRVHSDPSRLDFTRRVAEASQGNFLYARYKLDEAIPRLEKGEAPSAIDLPEGLDGIYREFLKRELAANLDRWEERYRPVLGLLTVARGDGLTGEQIANISHQKRSQADDTLRRCAHFLAGPDGQGRLRIYHQSFRDFLRQDAGFQVYPDEANATIADWYWTSCFDQATGRHNWSICDEYGLAHLPVHVDAAGQKEQLRILLLDYAWLQAKLDRTGVSALLVDFALGQVAADDAVRRLDRALEQGAYVLAQDPAQLAPQLLGRLLEDDNYWIGNLLKNTRQQAPRPTLLPQSASLRQSQGLVRILAGHTSAVVGAAVTRNGRVVSSSFDGSLKMWELATGRELRSAEAHAGSVNALSLTPDDQVLVSASSDTTLKVWNLDSGEELRTLTGHTGAVNGMAVTSDGRLVVSASTDGTLKVWNLASGEELRTLTGHTGAVNGVAITSDDRWAVSASSDRTLKVWELSSGTELRALVGHTNEVTAVVVTPDARLVVSVSFDNRVRVWDLADGHETLAIEGHPFGIHTVALTPDGRLVLTGAGSISGGDNTIKVWDIRTGELQHTFWGHMNQVNVIVVSPDSQQVISASSDRTLRLWELASMNRPADAPTTTDWVNGLTATPDGQFVISASRKKLRVWGIHNSTELYTLASGPEYLRSVALTPDGQLAISGSSDGTVYAWDVKSGTQQRIWSGHSARVNAVVVTSDGQYVMSTSADKTLKLWELATGTELSSLRGHTDEVFAVAATPDGRYAVSGAADQTLKVWDLVSCREVRTLQGHDGVVYAVTLTADGQIISASWDFTLKVWDLASGKDLRTLRGHKGRVFGVAVTPDGQHVISAAEDNMLKVWELRSGNCLATFHADGPLRACVLTPDSALVATGGTSGRVHFLRLED